MYRPLNSTRGNFVTLRRAERPGNPSWTYFCVYTALMVSDGCSLLLADGCARYSPKDVASVTAGCANVLHVGRRVDLSVSLPTLTVSGDVAGIRAAPGSCTSMTASSSARYFCALAAPAAGAVHSSERRAPPSIVRLLAHIHPAVLTKLTSCPNASTKWLPWLLYKPV
ncbi:hypothetical protein K466DRAFT_205955 [Polyporus arcularius HHB13444]|uniref:Uncharacterized protein n=1 Tax=Polyporus arcularius HHB13444 TaxID=1314778 RepID=A0A5C3PXQ5_9APHY|nr:hypothetical protein K466DRAFT_205955 [Polyporus arcularius HHB13444]